MTRIVVIGGDAAGASAASQAKRRRPDWDVVMVDRGRYTSYAACGLPYWVSGEIPAEEQLIARSPEQHRRNGLDVRMATEAVGLDLAAQTVRVRGLDDGAEESLGFDHLVIATGATPIAPPIPGAEAPNVGAVHSLDGTRALLDRTLELAGGAPPKRAVVVGAGFIGVEMAEAFDTRGLGVTVVDQAPRPMTTLDPEMSDLLAERMTAQGIDCRFGESVQSIIVGPDGLATAVTTDGGTYPADIVVLALGVRPNTRIWADAGLPTGRAGGLLTDRSQHVQGYANLWAAGDCAEPYHRLLRRPVFLPLGTHANKQGRVAGTNLGGGCLTFEGIIGTAVTRVGSAHVARTGLSEREAAAEGLPLVTATTQTSVRAGYMPDAGQMVTKVVVEAGSGRLLGGQILGTSALAAKRIDTLATAIWAGMTAEDLTGADLSYAPPVSPVWDPVQTAARVAAAKLQR